MNKNRLPPGQRRVSDMIAMPPIKGAHPHLSKEKWQLQIYGEVTKEITWNWNEFNDLPQKDFLIDFHCVTHWSKLDQPFSGVDFSEIIKATKPLPSAKYIIFEGADGYMTNVALAELKDNLAFIATKMNGKEIEDKFDGPARVVIPHLYGWKSTKYVIAIKFQSQDELGFWEKRGYHNHGDPWKEERYSN